MGGALKKSIVWLASYPKSGNTWARIFIANYAMNRQEPLPINEVRRFGTGDAVLYHYNRVAGHQIDPTDIDLTLKLRTPLLRAIVSNGADVNLVKTHNIRAQAKGVELVPAAITRSAVYVMRNPLDMVLSYARHYSLDIADAARAIGNSDNVALADANTVTQFLGSWSDHVKSWTIKAPYPTLVLKYEDMLAKPEQSFTELVAHMGMPVEKDRLERAIRFSSFKELVSQEAKTGFGEKSPSADKFFGKGTSGHWRDELDPAIAKIIRRDHKTLMKKYGYWDD